MNIFKGMSKSEIVVVVSLGLLLAWFGGVIVSAIIYLLPIAYELKLWILFLLGLGCISIGYFTLKRMDG